MNESFRPHARANPNSYHGNIITAEAVREPPDVQV